MNKRKNIAAITICIVYSIVLYDSVVRASEFRLGSAFVFNDFGQLLTAKHNVEGCDLSTIEVTPIIASRGSGFRAKVVAESSEYDLAALKIATQFPIPTSPIPIKTGRTYDLDGKYIGQFPAMPEKGETVYSGGFSHAEKSRGRIHIDQGKVTDTLKYGFWFEADLTPGSSGSPVVDTRGMLLGLVTRGENERGARTAEGAIPEYGRSVYAINGRGIVDFVRDHNLRIRTDQEGIGGPPKNVLKSSVFSITCKS